MKKTLLFSIIKKDLNIEYFSGTGKGGQYRNKHQNCVRMYHKDSNVRSTGQSHRKRVANLKEAFHNLVNSDKFKVWLNEKIYEITNKIDIEKEIEASMRPENLVVEVKNDKGEWVVE